MIVLFRNTIFCQTIAVSLAMMAVTTAAAQTQRRGLARPDVNGTYAADDDSRRAAASRLLIASRFRERQLVSINDSLRAAAAEMSEDCLSRAAAGRDMRRCEAYVAPTATMKARLAASQSDMIDEVMSASQTIYARHFTAAEMDEITRFFRTPVGQRYSTIYPQVLNEVQVRRREILRRYLAAAASPDLRMPHR